MISFGKRKFDDMDQGEEARIKHELACAINDAWKKYEECRDNKDLGPSHLETETVLCTYQQLMREFYNQ